MAVYNPAPSAPMPSVTTSVPSGSSGAKKALGALGIGAGLASGGWIPAAIGGAASLGSGLIGKHSNDKALKTEANANAAALAYQKEQDAKAEARQAEIDSKAEAAWNAEQSRLAPLRALKQQLAAGAAGRMGYSVPDMSGPSAMPQGWTPGQTAPGSIASLSRYPGAMPAPVQDPETPPLPEGITIADLVKGNWGSRAGRVA